MKVRAVRLGYYGDKRRRVGEVFYLTNPSKDFSDAHRAKGHPGWMEKVSDEVSYTVTSSIPIPPAEQSDESIVI